MFATPDRKFPYRVASSRPQVQLDSAGHEFSIVLGGPIYDFLERIGLVRRGLPNASRRIIALIGITWLPLLIFCLKDGSALNRLITIPFLSDFSMYGRYLLALPIFIGAELVIDPAIGCAVGAFVDSGIVQGKELPKFQEVLRDTLRLRDSVVQELLLLVLAFLPVFLFQREWGAGAVTSWHTSSRGLTSGGWWFATISSPLLRFIIYRWLFRYLIWTLLLWRIMRLDLHLMPTHPDHKAGLGFLALAQVRFGILFCALGCMVAGQLANGLVHQGEPVASFKFLMAGFVVLSVIVGLLPLALLAPKVIRIRNAGLLEYGKLGNQYTESFDLKWVHPAQVTSEPVLGTGDIQSLADLSNSYAIIDEMSIAPITKRLTVMLALQAAIPLIPLIVLGTPTGALVKAIMRMIM
jgi:hypothetical protein